MKVLASALVLGGFAAVFVFHPLDPALLVVYGRAGHADGTRSTLWSACLDPGAEAGAVALDGVEELAPETGCGDGPCPAVCALGRGERSAAR